MTAGEREYAGLLVERRPRVIRTRAAHSRALQEIEDLIIREDRRSKAESAYFSLLCVLVADYEHSLGAAKWARLEPLELLQELMTLKDVSQAEVGHALGNRAAASSILSGRRQISKTQAKRLGSLFEIDAGLFI